MNKYGGQKLPGRWARVKNKKNSVLMNPRRPGGVPAVGDRGTRGRWGCLTLKNSGFILFQLNKKLKLHWRKEYVLWLSIHQPTSPSKSAYFISTPVSSIKLWASCSNIPVFTGT